MLFHHGFLDTEYFMNYDLSFEEYFQDESNNEGMMTLCLWDTEKMKTIMKKENDYARGWQNVQDAMVRRNENI